MADVSEDTPLDDSTSSGPEVDASVTEIEAPDAVVEASPTIIVESGSGEDSSSTEAEIERAVDTAVAINDLQAQMGAVVQSIAELSERVSTLGFQQEMTEEVVTAVVEQAEVVEEAVAETVAEDLDLDVDNDPDTPPSTSGRHWFFKSWKELRGNR